MDHRISISLGIGLLGLVTWTALGMSPSALQSVEDFSAPVESAPVESPPVESVAAESAPAVSAVSEPLDPAASDEPSQESTTSSSGTSSSGRGLHAVDTRSADTRANDRPADDTSAPNRRPGLLGLGPANFSPEEIERAKPAATAFWEKYSPERSNELRSLPARRRNNWEEATTVAYLKLEQMREKSPDLYDIALKRVQAEDVVSHLVSELKKTNGDPKSSQPLHDAVQAVVKLNLQERQLRLDRLAKTLNDQQDALKSDEDPANLEKQINERLQTVMNERAPFPGRGGGAGGRGGRGNGQSNNNP